MQARRLLALALAPLVAAACDDFSGFTGGDGAAAQDDAAGVADQGVSPPDLAAALDLVVGDQAAPVDAAIMEDLSSSPDLAVARDLAMPDLAVSDLAMPDLARPDLAMPDLVVRDLAAPPDLVSVPDLLKVPVLLSFANAAAYTVGAGPIHMAAALLNNDAAPDLVVACGGDASVHSLLNNNGTGAFLAPVRRPTAASPVAVAAGDFNLDGSVDVVVTHESGPLSLLAGNNGVLAAPVVVPLAMAMGSTLSGVAAGDWNGDKKPDVAVVQLPLQGNGTVVPLVGQGDGTFKASAPLAVGKTPGRLLTLAADKDALPDVLVCNFGDPSAGALLGGQNGLGQGKTTQLAQGPAAAAAGDLDGDGVIDVAIAGSGGSVLVLLGKGDGSYNAAQPLAVVSTSGVAIADFDLDGRADIAASSTGATILVFSGNGDGTFKPALVVPAVGARFLVAADLNLDGKPDLAATAVSNNNMTNQVLVLLNTSK